MQKHLKDQNGFAIVEALLIFVIVALIAGTGYYVYSANKKTTDVQNAAAKVAQSSPSKVVHKKTTTVTVDPTASWTTVTSTGGGFTLKHPTTWVEPSNKNLCSADIVNRAVYLGPNAASVLKCGSEYFGQIGVNSVAGSSTGTAIDFTTGYTNVVKKTVMIDGVSAERTSAIASGQTAFIGSYPDGTIVVEYLVTAKGNTYLATYVQVPAGKTPSTDVLADFDLMMTKTLKFN